MEKTSTTSAKEIRKAVSKKVNEYLDKKSATKVSKLNRCPTCKDHGTPVATTPPGPIKTHTDREKATATNGVTVNKSEDALLLNTGLSATGQKMESGSGRDGSWKVAIGTDEGASSASYWIDGQVITSHIWTESPYENANWISYNNDAIHPRPASADTNANVYFKNTFNIGSAVDESKFNLTMEYYADNSIYEIYVNGVAQSTHYPNFLPQNALAPYEHDAYSSEDKEAKITLGKDWKTGANEVIIHLKSSLNKLGFLASFTAKCVPVKMPTYTPTIDIHWGDSQCDCLESCDYEVMYLTICNPYTDITFKDFSIGFLQVCDANDNPVELLPDGKPSIQLIPKGPHCFGDIEPGACVSREFMIITKGAKKGKYKLKLAGLGYELYFDATGSSSPDQNCFELEICPG